MLRTPAPLGEHRLPVLRRSSAAINRASLSANCPACLSADKQARAADGVTIFTVKDLGDWPAFCFAALMRNSWRYLVVLIAAFASVRPGHANDLLKVYQQALTQDTTLQGAIATRDAAIEARPQAVAQWLPQLQATGSATRDRFTAQTFGIIGDPMGACTQPREGELHCRADAHGYSFGVSQTLWSLEAFNRLREANRQAASAEATLLAAQQALLLRVARAYFGVLAARDQLAATSSEREAFRTMLEQAKSREQTGVGPRSDVNQAQAFYDATEQGVIDARNAVDDASLALAVIVGADTPRVAGLKEDVPLISPEPASADEWVTIARNDNPQLRAAQLRIEAADYEISAVRSRAAPVLSLSGIRQRSWQDPVLGGDQTADTVGVSVEWPLFQGGAVRSATRQSRALYRQAQADYATSLRDTEREVRAAFRGVITGAQRIAASRRAVDSARASVTASQRNVEFGTGTQFDLLNAQNNFSAAQRAYSQTRYDYLTSWLALKLQAGRLGNDDLATIDDLLMPEGP